MSWSTVTGIGILLAILILITYAIMRLLAYGEKRGVEKTLLEIEIANRKARENVDEITERNEEEYEKSLDATNNLEFDDVNRLLFDENSGEADPSKTA